MLGHRPNAGETDRALSALSHACRRRLLFELYQNVNTADGDSLDYSGIDLFESDERRTQLYHVHLPKLEEYGYITWNKSERTVQMGDRWEEIEPLLELIYSHLSDLPPLLQGKPPGRNGLRG